jgi:hypothetical protein
MAAKQESKSKTRINPLLAEQGEYAVGQARDIFNQMQGTRPSTYVGISDERQSALDQILAQAQGGGTGVAASALEEYRKTIEGEYLNANPYLDEIARRSAMIAGSSPVSGFNQQGRFGGGTMSNAMADAMTETTANIYGQNYQQERDRMNAMLGQAGTVDALQYADAERIGQVGTQYEQDQVARAQEDVSQWTSDADTLRQFLSLLSGNPLMGEVTTTMSSSSINPMEIASGVAGGFMNA